jgi:hypothetical protein
MHRAMAALPHAKGRLCHMPQETQQDGDWHKISACDHSHLCDQDGCLSLACLVEVEHLLQRVLADHVTAGRSRKRNMDRLLTTCKAAAVCLGRLAVVLAASNGMQLASLHGVSILGRRDHLWFSWSRTRTKLEYTQGGELLILSIHLCPPCSSYHSQFCAALLCWLHHPSCQVLTC